MKFADFVIPDTLGEARATLKKLGDSGFPVAGATSFQYLSERPNATAVDISRLGLAGITAEKGAFRIGATTTLADLARYRADGWVLHRIATLIPTHQIRNISTLGGNIARLFPWSEMPLGLLVLDATIVVQGDELKKIPAESFFADGPSKVLKPGDLITEVIVPAAGPGTGFGYRKEGVTNAAFGLMVAAAAITVDKGQMKRVRLAVGSGVPAPRRLPAVEKALEGQTANPAVLQAAVEMGTQDIAWKGRDGMSDDFGRHLGTVIPVDALIEALQQATGEKA
jgi:CO/xanthine dehydrogenase FAD-binding subunit